MGVIIVYRKPQAEINQEAMNGGIVSEYAIIHGYDGFTPAEVMSAVPAGATVAREVTVDMLPTTGRYRSAWEDNGSTITVNPAKAGELAHSRRRAARDRTFAPHLVVASKAAQGIPLKAGESVATAMQAMTDYKVSVDDVAQAAIEAAVLSGDVAAIEAAEVAGGWI